MPPSRREAEPIGAVVADARRRALQIVAEGGMVQAALTHLASTAERLGEEHTTVSILLVDEQGLLRNGASPNLPADYLDAIDGIRPDPHVGTCAAAAATGEPVLTPSFLEDPRWAELRHLPLAIGYQGAWSQPIKDGTRVLGTFGTYFRSRREPTAEERRAVELLAAAAAEVLKAARRG